MVYFVLLIMLVISTSLLVSGLNGSGRRQERYEKQLKEKYGNAVASCMVTNDLSYRKAQKRIEMEILERETERRVFTAMVDCPKCSVLDVHWLRRGREGYITRECRECGYEWKQT